MFVCEVLGECGYSTLAASSGDEALSILENRPEVVILITDVVMPGTLDGLGLISEVRSRWPAICVIVLSGRVPAEAAGNAAQTLFLGKPIDEVALVAALTQAQACVASHHLRVAAPLR
jgi:CheY-like chemotaxis protein